MIFGVWDGNASWFSPVFPAPFCWLWRSWIRMMKLLHPRHLQEAWVSLNKNDMMTWCFPTTDVFSTEVPGNFIVNIFSPTDQPGAKPPVPPEADPLFFFWVEWKMSGFPWHSFPIFVTIELYRWNHLAISGKIGQTSTSFTFFSLEKKHSFSQFSAWNYRHIHEISNVLLFLPWFMMKCPIVYPSSQNHGNHGNEKWPYCQRKRSSWRDPFLHFHVFCIHGALRHPWSLWETAKITMMHLAPRSAMKLFPVDMWDHLGLKKSVGLKKSSLPEEAFF